MAILYVLLIIAVVAGSLYWRWRRSQQMVKEWASQNGYSLLDADYALFFKGPFSLTTGKGQVVYRVVVLDRAGRTRRGWVRCGSWILGLLGDEIEAIMDRDGR